jgi:hypothetical protein
MESLRLKECLLAACLASSALGLGFVAPVYGAGTEYLPLAVGQKWILRNPSHQAPVVFEVTGREADGFRMRSTTPWGMSEWVLVEQDGKYSMIAYGVGGPMQPLPTKPVYLDFTRPAGSKWSGALGNLALISRTITVRSATRTYTDCIQIRQESGGNLLFTFAKGIGYVQFGEGRNAFVIDEAASQVAGIEAGLGAKPGAPHAASASPPVAPSNLRSARAKRLAGSDPFPIGITPNRYANEPLTVEVMMARFAQTLDAGAGFLVANGKWAELEPRKGEYAIDSVHQVLSVAAGADIPVSFTLRVIDTIVRDVPADLRARSWSDQAMRARLLGLIDTIAPLLKGRARWFMFGYEIDGYATKHPREMPEFIELYRLVKARMKQLVPDIPVSCTLTFTGLDQLRGPLKSLNEQLDFLALTYAPLQPDFTARNPSVVPADFAHIKEIAAGRKIFFQEIAYPTSPAARGSEENQAEFYRLALAELKRNSSAFAAVNFMTLADLSDDDAERFASFYGMKGNAAFKGVLQTLGLFDKNGNPKKSWDVLLSR